MIYNRSTVKAKVYTLNDAYDKYGTAPNAEYTRDIRGVLSLAAQRNTDDVRYKDCTHYFHTDDKEITDSDYLLIGNVKYKVLLVNNFARRTILTLEAVR